MRKVENKERDLKTLLKEGWCERFIACEPRLSEAVKLYSEAGYIVHLEPLPKTPLCNDCLADDENKEEVCRICFEGHEDEYRMIYTKKQN